MKKFKQALSMLLAFLLAFTLIPSFRSIVKADGSLPAADTRATLVGNFITANGLGNDWDPTNLKTIMKEYKDGLYEFAVNFTTANSDIEYKIALNGTWDKSYGDNGGNKKINLTAPQQVYFRFDAKTNTVYDSVNDAAQFKKTATLVGNLDANGNGGQNWNPGDVNYHMDYIGGGFFKKTFHMKAGDYEYKVAYDDKWSNGEVSDNVKLHVATESDVTFLANPLENICTDSVSAPSMNENVSIIGTIRGGNDWDQTAKGYEFSYLTGDGKFIYSNFYNKGNYEYKAVENYSWDTGGIPSSSNVSITIPDSGKYVVFVCDTVNRTIYDSVNNPDKVAEALGLQAPPVTVKSPVIDANGCVTFNYQNSSAKSVYLAGTMTGWGSGMLPMTKIDTANNIWSITLRLGDAAYTGAYKFVVDGSSWVTDPNNTSALDKDGNSVVTLPAYAGRKVVIAGTIQAAAGENTWTPSSDKTAMHYDGNGCYSLTIKDVPAGSYEYKVAMGSWDPENYGANGKSYGDNMKMTVPEQEDVTFWYNDDSHYTADSTSYSKLDITLSGASDIPADTKLLDTLLTGVYSAEVTLKQGTYNDIKAVVNGKEYSFGTIIVTDASKVIKFSFDPVSEIAFTDASSSTIDTDSIYFNSQDAQYKYPFGAVSAGSEVTFSLRTGKDITKSKLIIVTPDGTQKIDMTDSGSFGADSSYEKWTASFTQDSIGIDSYYFVVSNGSDVKAYGDDDGYSGAGAAGAIGSVRNYSMTVYDKDYKTPDWMKNAVVYQIFPDRFFNGDTSNDYAQTSSRGDTSYEFPSDWYKIPEDPSLEFQYDSNGNMILDKDGKPVKNPDFKGTVGDGVWSNEMYGGDLKGIQKKLDYLQSLGVNALYINPISSSISMHRYDTSDYSKVDPLLGHDEDFADLTKEAAKRGMHIILDGVFNHVSDDSIYFDRYGKYMAKGKPLGAYQYWSRVYDLMNSNEGMTQQEAEKQVTAYFASIGITDLHYTDWFQINNKKVAAVQGDPEHYDYTGWWGYDSMPTVQHKDGSEYNIQSWDDEIIDGQNANSRKWLREGASGWRLDVPNEIADDVWPHFRKAVKEEGDNVIIGEIWGDATKYLLGNMFDSVMNYRFRDTVLGFVGNDANNGTKDAVQAMKELELMREQYPKEAFQAMLNIVDSHDTQRIISALDGYQKSTKAIAADPTAQALAKEKLVPLIQMTYPGAPCIYYGDEAAMAGADDPDTRRGMVWGKGDKTTVEWYAKLANIRDAYPVLRTGDIQTITLDDSNKADVLAFSRNDADNHALVLINRKTDAISDLHVNVSSIPDGTVLTNALNPDEKYTVSDRALTVNVPAQSGVILVAEYKAVTVNESGLKDAYDPAYVVQPRVRASGLTIDKSEASVKVGESFKLNAAVAPSNATTNDVTWASSDTSVASVDAQGNVKGIKEGTAVITAVSADGGFKASCTVTVTKAAVNPAPVTPTPVPVTPSPAPAAPSQSGSLPKTGSPINTDLLIYLSILCIAGGAYLCFARKIKIKAKNKTK